MNVSPPPRGEARRAHLLEAALRVVARTGAESLTHRLVAQEASLPLAATTYWFSSKAEILEQAFQLAATRDVARIKDVASRITRDGLPSSHELVSELASLAAHELQGERSLLVAGFALWIEAARRPSLRETARVWTDAYVKLAATLMAAAGSLQPALDAQLLVAAREGLLLEQLSRDADDFELSVLRPALERLIDVLLHGPR